jgi:hypothetical protein
VLAGVRGGGGAGGTGSTLGGGSGTNGAAGTAAGGGISNDATLTVTNCTFSKNQGSFGGGVQTAGSLTLVNATIAYNTVAVGGSGGGLSVTASGTATLDNTIVALNTIGTTPDDIAGTVSPSSAFNLIGTGGSGGLTDGTNGNQVGVANPGLDPNGLQNNGGPTQTIALLPGSPAIGAGSSVIAGVTVPTTDQRGVARPSTSIDIGAFQDRGFLLTVVRGSSPQSTALNTAFANPLALTITSPYGDPVAGGVISFSASSSANGATAMLSATTATIAANGQASVTATANGTQGKYLVTAAASGQTRPAIFKLANIAYPNVSAAAMIGGSGLTIVDQSAVGRPAVGWGDPPSEPPLGIPQMTVTLGQVTALPARAAVVIGSTGTDDSSVNVPVRIGTEGQSPQRLGHESAAPVWRPAPRADVRLAARGRGWSPESPSSLAFSRFGRGR